MTDPAGSSVPDRPAVPATASPLASRLLHMLLFAVMFWLLCWAVALTAIVQLAFRVFGSSPSPELQRFGAGLARYTSQVIAYLSFASDRLPFPFSDWPQTSGQLGEDDFSGL